MDTRASDAERDACIERLRAAAAEGRLTFEELAERTEAASSAVTRGELAGLTADLPGATVARPADPRELKTIGDIKRSGAWVLPAESHFRSYLGAILLDLRQATITEPEIRIHAQTYFGNVVLLVPEGVDVDLRVQAHVGKVKHDGGGAVAVGAPRIVVTGGTLFGDVKVQRGRLWERLVRRRVS